MGSDAKNAVFSGTEPVIQHIINIPEKKEPVLPDECCIYKVPVNLRQVNEKAYIPILISIGPLHYGKPELMPMQEQKESYVHFFWERLSPSNKQALRDYKAFLVKKEKEIRNSYSDKYNDKKTEHGLAFLDMIFLDAVFILELFLRFSSWKSAGERFKYKDDFMLTKPWLLKSIQRDLLLLENQLPIFVLKELYDTVVPVENKKGYPNFLHLAHEYFESFDPVKPPDESVPTKQKRTSSFRERFQHIDSKKHNENSKNWLDSIHFTDFIRYLYVPKKFHVGLSPSVLRNAMKLNEAGISFEKVTDRRLLDLEFENKPLFSYFLCLSCLPYFDCFKARFLIPQLKVDHTTECVLRNLIAFEQCHYPDSPYICNYVSLIDSLIHTMDDVELLVETQVIVHELGSHKELATLVNGLCKHVVTDSTCYFQIIEDLNQHYRNIWNRTMAALKLVYFRDPWRSSSTVVGIAVLVFTIFNFCRIVNLVL